MAKNESSERAGISTPDFDDLGDIGNGMVHDADWVAEKSLFSTPIEGGRRSNYPLGGEPVASNCRSSEFKRKQSQQNIREISRKLEDDFGCPDSSDSTPANSPINLSASGSSPGSDSEDSTDFSHVKLRPRKFNFSPLRLLPAFTAALSYKKRGFTFAMSPPRDLLRRADFVAPEVHSARCPPQEAPQDIDEDAGSFLQDPPCASGSALSRDAGTETTYRSKEISRRRFKNRNLLGSTEVLIPKGSVARWTQILLFLD
ncbi:hypothetical protein R1sor_010890 [Riccia sorocarpa]|uniref:Uncharacterized protein n=1 Tax=Riccia sorocarpa TaxID=122646 RepID=A0ABD3I5D6_9MARC